MNQMRLSVAGLGAIACSLLLIFVAPTSALAQPSVQEIEQSVVRIISRAPDGASTGTGFVISNSHVATNHHVVDGANRLQVIPYGAQGEADMLSARVVWESEEFDLAVIRVQGLSAPPIKLASGVPDKLDAVIAVGYPGGADYFDFAMDATVTSGDVGRVFDGTWGSDRRRFPIIQHSAFTNPGNSGGPLLDRCGRVLGVNTAASLTVVQNPDGSRTRVTEAAGIYWSSAIGLLIENLDRQNIAYNLDRSTCDTGFGDIEGQAQEAQQRSLEAQGQASNAQQAAEQASEMAEGNRSSVEKLMKQTVVGGIVLAVLVIGTLLLTLKKTRQKVVQSIESYSSYVRRTGSKESASGAGGSAASAQSGKKASSTGKGSGSSASGTPTRGGSGTGQVSGTATSVLIGRDANLASAQLKDTTVSKLHARLTKDGTEVHVEDLNSKNGSFVNNEKLTPFTPVTLKAGDTLVCGTQAVNWQELTG